MARVIMGGQGDHNYQMDDDYCDMSPDRDSLRHKPSYVSKFANKVRQDLKNRKVCWSSMGLPSTLPVITPPRPGQSTPNFLPNLTNNSLNFGSKRASLSNVKSKPSSHTSLPYKYSRTLRLVPCPLPTQKVSKWDSYYKVKPTLVRTRKQVEYEDIDFDSMRRNGDHEDYSSGDREDTTHCQQYEPHQPSNNNYYPPKPLLAVEMKPKTAASDPPQAKESITNAGDEPPPVSKPTQNQFQLSKNNPMIIRPDDMEKVISSCHSSFKITDKRNTRGSLGILSPCICAKAYEMVKNNPDSVDLNNCDSPEDLQKKLTNITTDQALCDAFILQKLLEIRNRMDQPDKNPTCHNPVDDITDTDQLPSTCYNGDVNIIDRGQKDFILENALKCSRMQAKRGPRLRIEDWKGHGCDLSERMVFKKDYGQVPDYILKRKEEIQMEKELLERFEAEEANKKCRALSDEERKDIIEGLSQNWEKLFLEFQNLPLFSSSQRVLKRKSEIETQLRDLESDLRLISRHGQLLVANNAAPNAFLWS